MLKLVLTFALLLALPTSAAAKTFKIGDAKPAATITLPDTWDAETSDGGVEAFSPGKGIYLSAEVVAGEDLKSAGLETSQLLAEQKIKIKPETRAQKIESIGGLPAALSSWDATDEDGPTQVHLTLVKLNPQAAFLLLRWGDADQEKEHAAEIAAIEKSIAPIK